MKGLVNDSVWPYSMVKSLALPPKEWYNTTCIIAEKEYF